VYHQSGSEGMRVLCTAVLTWRAQSGGVTNRLLFRYPASFDIRRSAATSQAVDNRTQPLSNQQIQRPASSIKTSGTTLHFERFLLNDRHASDPAALSAPDYDVLLTAAPHPDSYCFWGEQGVSTSSAEQHLESTRDPSPCSRGDVSRNRDCSLRQPGMRRIDESGVSEKYPHSGVCKRLTSWESSSQPEANCLIGAKNMWVPQSALEMEKFLRLVLVLADSALERVPKEILSHPSVQAEAKRRRKRAEQLLLDRSLHHAAMRRLKSAGRRGRPDIVHFCLLEALGSILCRESMLEVYVHTVEDRVITLNPRVRLPRVYDRFKALIETLYVDGAVKSRGETLLELKRMNISRLISSVDPSIVAGTSEHGSLMSPHGLGELLSEYQKPLLLVGAFPHGEFKASTARHVRMMVSIYRKPLEAWTVVSRVVTGMEEIAYYRKTSVAKPGA